MGFEVRHEDFFISVTVQVCRLYSHSCFCLGSFTICTAGNQRFFVETQAPLFLPAIDQ